MQFEQDLSLGKFGDVRLDKGGRHCCAACFARAVCACAGLRKGFGLRKCAIRHLEL
jgi:hypothetical protein